MKLLERVLGRSSRDKGEADDAGRAASATGEAPVESAGIEASGPANSRASLIQSLQHQVAEGSRGRFRAHEVHEDGQLFDRGYLDSFSYVEFLVFIEKTYGVRIEDSQLAGQLNTIAAMAEHILREEPPPAE